MSGEAWLRIEDLGGLLDGGQRVAISRDQDEQVGRALQYLRKTVADGDVVYGVNTGFGSLQSARIRESDLERLQVGGVRFFVCEALG